jgi:hypothetical protein
MTIKMRELYGIPGGDRWFLARDIDTGRLFVRHEANQSSGGKVTELAIGQFLRSEGSPEQRELLRLIGTLIDDDPVRDGDDLGS